jgi:hypothetical protein
MNVFSKFADVYDSNINDKTKEKFTVDNYFKNKINLSKMNLKELKEIGRNYKIKITATKPVLIERIQTYFKRLKNTIFIQSIIRRYLVKLSFRLRGPALKNRKLCVNDTDFYTLEPLSEINHKDFYSYMDKSGFIYGFDLNSIITLLEQGKYINPYNREHIDRININQIFSLLNLTLNIYNDDNKNNNNNENQEYLEQSQNNTISPNQTITNKIRECRLKTTNTRIQELFMEIDYQGNYTQSSWFSDLDRSGYNLFLRSIYDIWNYRLNPNVQRSICPYYNPIAFEIPPYNILNGTIDEAKNCSLSIIENIVYGTNDIENKKIGILHALTALTLVSEPARLSIPWLYESIRF